MKIPKVIFKPMSLEDNIDIVKWAFFENGDTLNLHDSTVYFYPELVDVSFDDKDVNIKIEDVVRKYYFEKNNEINSDVSRYFMLWSRYNDVYFKKMCEYLNLDDIDDIVDINVTVGYIPVCPRDLKIKSFSLNIGIDDNWLLHLCAHEILHFLWFKKWKSLYPNCSSDEFNSPFLPWRYSEMVTDPILNSKFINDLFDNKFSAVSYESFYSIKDKNGNYLMNILKDIYNSDRSIESKIKDGFNYICSVLEDEVKS